MNVTERRAYVRQFILDHKDWSNKELAKQLNMTQGAVRSVRLRLGVNTQSLPLSAKSDAEVHEDVVHDTTEAQYKAKIDLLNRKNKELMKLIGRLEVEKDAIFKLSESKDFHKIEEKSKSGKTPATAIILASDWHVEETVTPESVLGANEYNPTIARKRAELFFQNGLKLIRKEQQDVEITNVVLGILGDMISNGIHDELMETNAMEPIEAIMFAQELLRSGLKFWLSQTDFQFTIVCHTGNHGRTTKKIQTNEHSHSLEHFMYHSLKHEFKNEKRMTFIIPESYHSYLEIHGKVVRFHHGHAVRGGSGVGGMAPSLLKAVGKWNNNRRADIDCIGHFHQYVDFGNVVVNGSMIGYNAYAQRNAFSAEPPRQAMFLIDAKRGKTVSEPIMFI